MVRKKLSDFLIKRYIELNQGLTVKDALKKWEKLQHPSKVSAIIYITDDENRLVGIVDLRDLFLEEPKTRLKSIMRREFYSVKEHQPVPAAIGVVVDHEISEVPVLDKKGRLKGVVLSERLLDAVDWENKRNIHRLAGIIESEERVPITPADILKSIQGRVLWLVAAAVGGVLLAGGVIDAFSPTLVALPVLAVFIPVLMNTGGGIGTQAAAALIRGLAVEGHEELHKIARLLLFDILTGTVLGVVIGSLIGLMALLIFGDLKLANVLFISTMLIGGLGSVVGFLIPAVTAKLGRDPTSSIPLITTIKDATSLLIYFIIVRLLYF
jgi:magnesium transporter